MHPSVQALTARHVENQRLVLEAVMKKDLSLAFNAFCNDSLMTGCSIREARALFNEMIENTKKYLGWFGL